MEFNIRKVGNLFKAFDTVNNVYYGYISIKSGKFVGDTRCLVSLNTHVREYKQAIIDKVIEQIKKDVTDGDLTAVDELLGFVPMENLEGYLSID